ncbi:hypothetical protein C8R47DRAFT_314779 [Mycena vitilis]|nr:hypothetical protein C8R47DRAFT_314779 [Mycena vitilis]
MNFLPLYLLLAPLLVVHSAITTTPPQFDPQSPVCPGLCLGTYTKPRFSNGTCFATVGLCLCTGAQESPPLGDLKSCLGSPTCNMSDTDTETYITQLLAFEGCSVSSSSVHVSSDSTSTSGGQSTVPPASVGRSVSGQPPASTSSKTGGAMRVGYYTHSGVLVGCVVTLAGALFGALWV